MSLLDDPLDNTFGGRLAGLDRLSMAARWGWSVAWGIPALCAVVLTAYSHGGLAVALLLAWCYGMFAAIVRMYGRTWGGSKRMWLVWVIYEYLACIFVITVALMLKP